MKEFITLQEAAPLMGLSVAALRRRFSRYAQKGQTLIEGAFKLNDSKTGTWLIPARTFEIFLKSNEINSVFINKILEFEKELLKKLIL